MKTLVNWHPAHMNRLVDRLFDDFSGGASSEEAKDWRMPLDVVETDHGFEVTASLPGVATDDIDITYEDHVLTIKAENKQEESREDGNYHIRERRFGRFSRSLRMSTDIDMDKIEANYENGILTLTLPKAEAVKPKRITIKTNGESA